MNVSVSNDVQSLLGNAVNQAVVRITGADGSHGINGFLFDIVGDEETNLEAEITDHYIETNSSIQDHIALRPRKYTLSGYIGELNDALSQTIINALNTLTGVNIVEPYLPQFTVQSAQVYTQIAATIQQEATLANNVINSVNGIYSLLSGIQTSATRQQYAYQVFLNLWQNQRYKNLNLCTIETPWEILTNMAVERVSVLQRDDNRYVSEFSITFKEMRFVDTELSSQVLGNPNGAPTQTPVTNQTLASPVDNMAQTTTSTGGTQGVSVQNGQPVTIAILEKAFNTSYTTS